ncbi:glycosyltransferase [Larkinella soli]|uniref:glycosyltransferase n=1 Tax=Larkinella soli TaxID=1770527 RepID=UPI001E36EE73|nr:glycosyltransferase [Larkinella soli]
MGGVDAGGQNIAVAELAQHLARLGYSIDIFTRREDGILPEIVHWRPGIRVVQVKAGPARVLPKEEILPLMGEFTENVIGFSRREGHPYLLIHAHFFMSALVAAEVKKVLGIPFIVTFHALGKVRRMSQGDGDRFPPERLSIEERVIREADQVIALCPQDREDLIALYEADPARITVIPNGFDPNEIYRIRKETARRLLGLDPYEFIILQLGRMVPRKGIDNVVQAVRVLDDAGLKARLLVVGGESDSPDPAATPEIARLQRLAASEGIAGQVTFVGRRDRRQLRYYYGASDVFVTTPWYEPFGITPLEAMACGVPVVGSAVGGIKHTVVDGETGFLVPPKDPVALAEKLEMLLRRPEIGRMMGARGLERVHAEFTWEKVACLTSGLYEQIGLPQTLPLEIEKSLRLELRWSA